MKNKLITYLLAAVVISFSAVGYTPITAHAITQDEGAAYANYIHSLISQGYSKEDIRAYLRANGDGSIATAMAILPEAVANGSLKKAGQVAPAQAEDKGAAEKKEDQTTAPAHEHQYSANLTTNPTCTEEGVMTYTCSCGDSYTEPYPKLEHQYEKEITREATCAEEGEKTVRCTVCGEEISKEPTPVKEHQAGDSKVTVEPTLFKEGVSETYCKDCGALMTSESVPAKLNSTQQTIASVVTGVAIALILYLGISRAVTLWKRHKATKG